MNYGFSTYLKKKKNKKGSRPQAKMQNGENRTKIAKNKDIYPN